MKTFEEIINQLTCQGWIVKEHEKHIGLKAKYSTSILIKLSKQRLDESLSEDELYSLSILSAIEQNCIQYGWYAENLEKHKQNTTLSSIDLLIHGTILAMDDEIENVKTYLTKVYYKRNWQTLKPMLELIVNTSRKTSKVYNEAYKTLCETCDSYNASKSV